MRRKMGWRKDAVYDAVVGRSKATKAATAKTTGVSKAKMVVEGEEGGRRGMHRGGAVYVSQGSEQKSS